MKPFILKMWIISIQILILILTFGYTQSDPCTKYQNLDSEDDYFRSVANADGSICDNTLNPGWYRVTSNAGERMPTECIVGGSRCGAFFPIWMNGSYPDEGNVNNVTACAASYDGNCCQYSYNIEVKNCSEFLVYNLVPVTPCNQAYCFGSELPCPTGQTSGNGFTPGCESDPCYSDDRYDVLEGEMKRSSNYTLSGDDTPFEDSRLSEGWYKIDSVTGNDIVNESVPMMRCGTIFPLWMKGSIPDVTNGIVNGIVCMSGTSGPCGEEYNIRVRNCGGYRLYYLKPPNVDKSAYCFGTLPVPDPTTTTTTTPSPTGSGGIDDDTDIDEAKDKERSQGPIIAVIVVLCIFIVILSAVLTFRVCKTRNLQKRAVSAPPHVRRQAQAVVYTSNQDQPPSYEESINQNGHIFNTTFRANNAFVNQTNWAANNAFVNQTNWATLTHSQPNRARIANPDE